MKCVEYTLKWLTLCAAWTFALAQDIPSNYPSQSDDDFDPQDFEEAQNYLAKYYYFHGPKPANLKRPSDMKTAIEEMQDFVGLPVTGKLDRKTMTKMRSRRCGVADFTGPRQNARLVRRKRFALAGQKWSRKSLTYRILNYTPDLSRDQVRRTMKKSLQTWADHTPLTFREVTGGRADIDILFATGEHGDGFDFDGQGGTLAHAYFPGSGIGGDAHFDDDEHYTEGSYRGTNLFVVAAHELGHSLGLAHSSNEDSLMAPYYQGYQPEFRLPHDDIMGIQSLYGKAPYRPPQRPSGPNRPTWPDNPNTPNRPPWRPEQPPHRPEQPERPEQPPHRPEQPERPPWRPEQPPWRPDQPPNRPPSGPDACSASFQAAMSFDGRVYLFQGSQFWVLEENGRLAPGYPQQMSTEWRNAPTNIDAAFMKYSNENVVFFKGNTWYEYQGRRLFRRGVLSDLGFPNRVRKIDAAATWEGNSLPYIFAGNDYYRLNARSGRVDPGYPKLITPNWVNIPANVNAAFGFQGFTYFIQGRSYYQFDNNVIRTVAGPRDFGEKFLGCKGRRRNPLMSISDGSQSRTTFLLPMIILIGYLLL